MDTYLPLSPSYALDLRRLVSRAFAAPAAISAHVPQHGTIQERVEALPTALGRELVTCAAVPPPSPGVPGSDVREIPATDYWRRSLAERFLVVGPLLDISHLDVPTAERLRLERRLLAAYCRGFLGVPLPIDLLTVIRDAAATTPELLPWLDSARERVLEAPSVHQVVRATRWALRMDALRKGMAGQWSEEAVSTAELMTDVLLLCRAAREDVERAAEEARSLDGSISLALLVREHESDAAVPRAIASMDRPVVSEDEVRAEELSALRWYAARRTPMWRVGLLPSPNPRLVARVTVRDGARPVPKATGPVPAEPNREAAAETYRRIREDLEKEIVARRDLCRRLALIGTAHLHGVTHQRLLICGPSGSGKTHAARALSRVLGRPFLQVDMSDITGTGWRGKDIPDVLDTLLRQAKDASTGVLHLDEIDKCALGEGTDGNSREAKLNVQAGLLALLDGQPVTPDAVGRDQIETAGLLVVGTGAFGDRFKLEPPSTEELVQWGWMPELAARWGERICLGSLTRADAIELLRSSERSVARRLAPLTTALGIQVEVTEHLLAYVADLWIRTGADYRTASEWLLVAARRRVIETLEGGDIADIVLAPDDVGLPPRYGTRKGRL